MDRVPHKVGRQDLVPHKVGGQDRVPHKVRRDDRVDLGGRDDHPWTEGTEEIVDESGPRARS